MFGLREKVDDLVSNPLDYSFSWKEKLGLAYIKEQLRKSINYFVFNLTGRAEGPAVWNPGPWSPASFPVVPGKFGYDVTRKACQILVWFQASSRLTHIARVGLGTRPPGALNPFRTLGRNTIKVHSPSSLHYQNTNTSMVNAVNFQKAILYNFGINRQNYSIINIGNSV